MKKTKVVVLIAALILGTFQFVSGRNAAVAGDVLEETRWTDQRHTFLFGKGGLVLMVLEPYDQDHDTDYRGRYLVKDATVTIKFFSGEKAEAEFDEKVMMMNFEFPNGFKALPFILNKVKF